MPELTITEFTDPGCPFAWSAEPARRRLDWLYGAHLAWELRMVGLTESGARYEERGYTPVRMAQGFPRFRTWAMPFGGQPRERMTATARACRTVIAARLADPAQELPVFRALQLAQFTSTAVLDTD